MTLRRRVVRHLVGQFHRPHGLGGYVAGWVMAHRSSNVRRNLWVVSLLEVKQSDRILEVGFGPGIAVAALSGAGRVDLRLATADALPDFGDPLDKVVAVNSMGFWPEPVARLKELHGLLRAGGTIAVASQPRCPGATADTSAKAGEDIEERLRDAGFSPTRVETLDLDPPVVCVLAVTAGTA
jgi:hypothetical protein